MKNKKANSKMFKIIATVLSSMLILSGCSNRTFTKEVKQGKLAIERREYDKAREYFELALEEKEDDNIKNILEQIDYMIAGLQAKENSDIGEAVTYFEKIVDNENTFKSISIEAEKTKLELEEIIDGQKQYDIAESKKVINDFFLAIQEGELEKANNLLHRSDDTKMNIIFASDKKNRISKAYYSTIEFEIMPNHSDNMDLDLEQNRIVVKVKKPIIFPIMDYTLDEITYMGLGGSIYTGFQEALSEADEILIKNIKDKTNEVATKTIDIIVVKKENKYLLKADAMLHEELVDPIEIIFTVFDKILKY